MNSYRNHDEWRDGFLFVGNQLALDFLNTRPLMDGQFVELLPDVAALLRWYVAAELIEERQSAKLLREWKENRKATRVVDSIREFRERLREQILAWEDGRNLRRSTLEELDRLLATHPMLTRMRFGKDQPTTELWFPVDVPEDLFAPLAYSVAKLFSEADRSRIRKCGACILHFLDSSKKGNRHWCSMQLCGNRAKVAAYAARQTAGESME